MYQDEHFATLYPVEGQPAYEPWRLALITVLHYAEGLTDRQAANAVRERIDWKYALGLELTDAGFDFSVLSECASAFGREPARDAVAGSAPGGLQRARLAQSRWQATHRFERRVLARVRSLSNLECVGETLRTVLDDLAALAPDWLVQHITPDWFERVPSPGGELSLAPSAESQRTALAQQIDADGVYLLQSLEKPEAPDRLKDEASVRLLRQVGRSSMSSPVGRRRGELVRKSVQRKGSFVPRMIRKLEPAKSGRPSGWDTKCI